MAERHAAPRVRDRFNRDLLVRYLEAMGIRADDPAFWIGATLLQHRVTFVPRSSALADLRREYGID